MSKLFVATKYIFVIVYNQDYSITRTVDGYQGFDNINEVVDDFKNVQAGWKTLQGYRGPDVRSRKNADRPYFSSLFSELRKELLNNSNRGEKTLLWFYYAGHGVMKNLVYAVCTDNKSPYPLEQ